MAPVTAERADTGAGAALNGPPGFRAGSRRQLRAWL